MDILQKFASENQLAGAWLHGFGGASEAELGYYNLATKSYQWRLFPELMEITSLQGNLAWKDNQPIWHVHTTLSGSDFQAVGGHVKKLLVAATCELKLTPTSDKLSRAHDETIGLDLLAL